MTTHAGEGTAVAQRTALLHDSLGGMRIVEIRRMMICWLEIGPFGIMAFGTAEGRVDLAVAHQTVSHLRHVGRRRVI